MARYDPGDFVKVGRGATARFGRVVGRNGRRYRVFTTSREQVGADGRQLKAQRPAILVLESTLSAGREGLRSDLQRRDGVLLEEIFRSLNFTVLRERVHSAQDLQDLMKYARHQDVLFIHWSGHGIDLGTEGNRNRAGALSFSGANHVLLPYDSEEYLRNVGSQNL